LSAEPGLGVQGGLEVAIVDGASFVLPYDHGLIGGLVRRGHQVRLYASRTRYNGEFLDALRALPGVTVIDRAVSGSVASRIAGVLAYAGLLLSLWRDRARLAVVNLQFSVLAPLEWPLCWMLRDKLVYTVHNAVPHGHSGLQHGPTRRLAELARQLVFASVATEADFLRRYGAAFAAKSTVLQHGLLPIMPGDAPLPVRPIAQPEALVFWGTVKGYKGIELLADLARSSAFRALGLPLEVHGRWDAALRPLRDDLAAAGVRIVDDYLDAAALRTLTARPVLFLLPYRDASQSGALYTLLHQGCTFACSDTGDLSAFLRRHGLQALLLADRSVSAVMAVLQRLREQAPAIAKALQTAQEQSTWDQTLALSNRVYGTPSSP
jgi:hypothetical protein